MSGWNKSEKQKQTKTKTKKQNLKKGNKTDSEKLI